MCLSSLFMYSHSYGGQPCDSAQHPLAAHLPMQVDVRCGCVAPLWLLASWHSSLVERLELFHSTTIFLLLDRHRSIGATRSGLLVFGWSAEKFPICGRILVHFVQAAKALGGIFIYTIAIIHLKRISEWPTILLQTRQHVFDHFRSLYVP